jgi:hypothetical protein
VNTPTASRRRAAERLERRQVIVDRVDVALEGVDVALLDARQLGASLGVGGGELGAEVEQLVLDPAIGTRCGPAGDAPSASITGRGSRSSRRRCRNSRAGATPETRSPPISEVWPWSPPRV